MTSYVPSLPRTLCFGGSVFSSFAVAALLCLSVTNTGFVNAKDPESGDLPVKLTNTGEEVKVKIGGERFTDLIIAGMEKPILSDLWAWPGWHDQKLADEKV